LGLAQLSIEGKRNKNNYRHTPYSERDLDQRSLYGSGRRYNAILTYSVLGLSKAMCPITVPVSGSVRIPLMIKECVSTVELLLTAENQGKQYGKRARPEGAYGDITPLILNFRIDGGVWASACPGSFIAGKIPRYPVTTRLGWPQIRSQSSGGKKKLSFPSRESNHESSPSRWGISKS
jgi:hypothetical protein